MNATGELGTVQIVICRLFKRKRWRGLRPCFSAFLPFASGQKLPYHVQQVLRTMDLCARHQGRFLRACQWKHQFGENLIGVQCQTHGQRAACGPEFT